MTLRERLEKMAEPLPLPIERKFNITFATEARTENERLQPLIKLLLDAVDTLEGYKNSLVGLNRPGSATLISDVPARKALTALEEFAKERG